MEKLLIEEKQLPSKNKTIIYGLLVVFSFFYLKFLNSVFNSVVASMSWNIFIDIVILIIGWDDIWKYLKIVNNYRYTMVVGVRTLAYQTIIAVIFLLALSFVNINDPQGIKHITYSFKDFFYLFSFDIILTAVGEEFWKLLMILIVLKLLSKFKTMFWIRYILAVTMPSIIFGLAHNINYLNTAWMPIAAMTIPSFIIFLKYKSILPLIIAHFFFDLISYVSKVENQGNVIVNVLGLFLIVGYIYLEKELKRNP